MSAEPARQFVDTNVLVYAHDVTAGDKHTRAKQLVADLWADGTGCLSVQVLQEFYVTVTRKVQRPLEPDVARQHVEDLAQWLVHSPTVGDVVEAIQLHQVAKLAFWDAMVLISAEKLNCQVLWSEDLNTGQNINGIMVRNPFVANA
jgi:predicted nucleic acid-binding protein